MIGVTRVAAPAHLASAEVVTWTRKLCDDRARYYRDLIEHHRGVATKKPTKPKASAAHYGHAEVRASLRQMFGRKCAYCEGDVAATSYLHVEHFRPASSYPALAYNWNNLLLACERCNSKYKKAQFPVAPAGNTLEENRWNPGARDSTGETPFLLNPCIDDPSAHLTFLSGYVTPTTEYGRRTARVCRLNRVDLVESRREHLDLIRIAISLYKLAEVKHDSARRIQCVNALRNAAENKARYAATTRAELDRQGIDWQTL